MNENKMIDLMQLLEAVEQGDLSKEACLQQNPAYRDDLIELFTLTDQLQAVSLPEPDPRFRSSARKRILTAMQAKEPVTFWTWFRHKWQSAQQFSQRSPAMTIALIVALVMSLVGGSSAYASQEAIPGDLLYPLKIQIEDLQLATAPDDLEENLYYQIAEERVEELLVLIELGRYEDISAAMSRLETALGNVSEKGRPDTVASLTNSLSVLTERLGEVPDAAAPGLEKASEAVQRAQERLSETLPEQTPEQAGEGKPGDVPGGKPEGIPTVLPTQAQGEKPEDVPGGKPTSFSVPPTQANPAVLPTVVPTMNVPADPVDSPSEAPVTPVDPPAQPTTPVNPPVQTVAPDVQPTIPPTDVPVNPVVPSVEPPVQPSAQPTVPAVTPPGGRP